MKVLWTHNFDPNRRNAGCFMKEAAAGLRELGLELKVEYLGNLRSASSIVRAARSVRQLAKGFDLVHAQYGSACAFATSFVRDRPLVVTIRGNDWNVHSETFSFLYLHTRLARFLTARCLSRYQGVVTVSRRLEEDIQRHWKHCRTRVLPSPIDLRRWVAAPPAHESKRDGFDVLFVAQRLDDPVKRFSLAKKAIERAKLILPNIRFHTAASVPFEEMPAVVARMDAVLCTSETEGWPNCVKEALACNVPFVATDVSDLKDIADVEESCRVVDSNPEALAAALCEVLRRGKLTGLRKFVEKMEVRSLSKELVAFYEEILGSAAGSGREKLTRPYSIR